MKLIVGLGNKGSEYNNTRHNVGFMVIDEYLNKHNLVLNKEKFDGLYCDTVISDEKVIILKPQKYMNLSGEVILKFVNYFKIKPQDILVIHDDLDMPVAKIKLKENGSSGGHNGIKNIILNLNTEEFKRLKIGINKDSSIATKDYVLGKFNCEEKEKLDAINAKVISILVDYFKLPFNDLMSKYNRR